MCCLSSGSARKASPASRLGNFQHDREVVGCVVAAVDLVPGAAVPRAHRLAPVEHGLPVIVVAYCVLNHQVHGRLFGEAVAPPLISAASNTRRARVRMVERSPSHRSAKRRRRAALSSPTHQESTNKSILAPTSATLRHDSGAGCCSPRRAWRCDAHPPSASKASLSVARRPRYAGTGLSGAAAMSGRARTTPLGMLPIVDDDPGSDRPSGPALDGCLECAGPSGSTSGCAPGESS